MAQIYLISAIDRYSMVFWFFLHYFDVFFKFQYEKTSLFEQLYDIVIEDIEDRIVKPKLT